MRANRVYKELLKKQQRDCKVHLPYDTPDGRKICKICMRLIE